MEQLPLFAESPATLSVTELTRAVRARLESDDRLQDVWVSGEVSNLSRASSGHIYLTLKDESASLRCVMWRNWALRLRFDLQNGLAVEAHGSIGVFERDGSYQLYIDTLRPSGEGALFMEFLRLKARLEAEGLFAPERKRPLPAFPRRIGIVTSPTGAALQDMLNTLRRRYPLAEVLLAPSAVQGSEAPAELVRALARLAADPPDVVIVARGGGSLEDLWAFNDETVVRAIAAMPVPVVTGIGHETDFTLADFAADMRAPTPTAAAERVSPDRADLAASLAQLARRLATAALGRTGLARLDVSTLRGRLDRAAPLWRVSNERQRLDGLAERLARAVRQDFELRRARLESAARHLESLNPLAVLRRGYAVIRGPDGRLLTRAAQARLDDVLTVRLSDGEFNARVTRPLAEEPE